MVSRKDWAKARSLERKQLFEEENQCVCGQWTLEPCVYCSKRFCKDCLNQHEEICLQGIAKKYAEDNGACLTCSVMAAEIQCPTCYAMYCSRCYQDHPFACRGEIYKEWQGHMFCVKCLSIFDSKKIGEHIKHDEPLFIISKCGTKRPQHCVVSSLSFNSVEVIGET